MCNDIVCVCQCWVAQRFDTVTFLHMLFPLSQSCGVHLITLLRHSRWLKVATTQSCICHGCGARFSVIASEVTGRPSRSVAGAAAVAQQQTGVASTADLMTLQQQIRQEMADSLQRLREEMQTAVNDRLDAISSIPSAMRRFLAGPAETAKPYRISELIPKSWNGSHDKGQFRNFMAELHL